jgi:hypothetical protein
MLQATAGPDDVPIGQYLFAGDDVSGAEWQDRGWRTAQDVHLGLFELAAQAALRLVGP